MIVQNQLFVSAGKPVKTEEETIVHREPFSLSTDESGGYFEHVTALREDSPFEYCTIGGIDFQKRVYSPDRSLKENETRQQNFLPRLVTRLLTEKQAEQLRERAKIVKIVRRSENGVRKEFVVADWLLLCKTSEYNPNPAFVAAQKQIAAQEKKIETASLAEKIEQAIITEQAKPARAEIDKAEQVKANDRDEKRRK